MKRAAGIVSALIAAVALTGCMGAFTGFDDGGATSAEVGGPGFHVRDTDFYWSYGTWGDTHRDEYTWKNPEGQAHLEVDRALREGSILVEIHDANGSVVWSRDFGVNDGHVQYTTGSGTGGDWTIVIDRHGAEGPFDLHVWRAVQ